MFHRYSKTQLLSRDILEQPLTPKIVVELESVGVYYYLYCPGECFLRGGKKKRYTLKIITPLHNAYSIYSPLKN